MLLKNMAFDVRMYFLVMNIFGRIVDTVEAVLLNTQ